MSDLLKFLTCGSVDDGKSTLIGHLLYDSKLLYADQEKALELDSKVGSAGGQIDYSLLLDGLMAEREQGITIDVAYRYFTTDRRSFIVADCPGHEEYTRNMAVGASFADLAVILIDASKGVLVQTRRHARICALMGIKYFIFAVNKMDLVEYSKDRFDEISSDVEDLAKELDLKSITIIPVSATKGDNITKPSENMTWFTGKTVLDYLETVDITEKSAETGFYMPVQRVNRPDRTFRGFQGQVESGTVNKGDELTVLPSNEKAVVDRILVGDKDTDSASKDQPVTICLNREIDVSRGDVLTKNSGIGTSNAFRATLLWMDDDILKEGKEYFIKLGTKKIGGVLKKILYKTDINTGEKLDADILKKNEIALCEIILDEKIPVDLFKNHKTLGELILIDRVSHMTSACGVVEELLSEDSAKAEYSHRHFNTTLLHGEFSKDYPSHATLPAISQVTAFSFDSAEEQAKTFEHKSPDFAYTRVANPTVSAFEQRMCSLEGGNTAIAVSSGMAAIHLAILNITESGDEIIASSGLYGGTIDLFRDFEKFGIKVNYVPELSAVEVEKHLNEHTKLLFTETIGNPALHVTDIKEAAEVAHKAGIPLIVDNTTATPYLVNPISLGADIVIHSSSKYINGNGNSVSGVIIDSSNFEWDFEKFTALSEYKKFGRLAFSVRLKAALRQDIGCCLSPFNAYLNILGLETLGLRMEKISRNAFAVASELAKIPGVEVNYPLLSDDDTRLLVNEELHGLGGGMFTFRVGSKEKAYKVLNSLKLVTIASNLGDVRTLALHPSSTLFVHSSKEEKENAGVYDDLIRVSVGIEDAPDLIADFKQAISKASEKE